MSRRKSSFERDNFGIYAIYAAYKNAVYIGSTYQSFYTRFYTHSRELRCNKHDNQRLQNIYNKYGKDALVFMPIDICTVDDLEFIRDIEQDWINYYRKDNSFIVLNISNVTAPNYIDPLRSEKLRIANTKNIYNNLVDPDGNVHNDITNLKEFSARYGMKFADLHGVIRGNRKSCHGWHMLGVDDFRKTPIYSFIAPDGVIHSDIHSLKLFCEQHNLQEAKMCNVWKGKRNQHKGWKKDFSFGEKFRAKRY